jgi:Cdc6-like AAA superfamily ATPase
MENRIFVKLGANSATSVELPEDCSGIYLRRYLKENTFKSKPGFEAIKLTDIKFELSTQRNPLGANFFSKYQHSDHPLAISVHTLLTNPIPEQHRNLFWASDDAMKDLAADLQVSNVLYVRHCYHGIYEEIMEYVRDQSLVQALSTLPCNIFLTGTPGIGKTSFLLYFIHKLVKSKRPVVFGSKTNSKYFHCWDNDGLHRVVSEGEIEKLRKDSANFFVMDSMEVSTTRGPCLVSSSPRDNIAHQFRKNAATFYMPPWNWDEIYQCYELIYSTIKPDLGLAQLAARFYVLGGVPRLLFDNTRTKACTLIDDALNNTNWNELKQVAQSDGAKTGDSVSHRLVHRFNQNTDEGEYSGCDIRFASQYVTFKLLQHYANGRREMLVQFLDETSNLGFTGTLRGCVFEAPGHLWFRKGILNQAAKLLLPDGKSEHVNLTICAKKVDIVATKLDEIMKNSEFRTDETKYFKPLSKTFECIDSWIIVNGETWGIQFTVATTHRISSAVYWYYKNLNLRHYLTVVYDEQKYNNFKHTKISDSKKIPFKEESVPLGFDIKQYVVRAELQGELINNLNPWDDYEAFVPNPDDPSVLAELGIVQT